MPSVAQVPRLLVVWRSAIKWRFMCRRSPQAAQGLRTTVPIGTIGIMTGGRAPTRNEVDGRFRAKLLGAEAAQAIGVTHSRKNLATDNPSSGIDRTCGISTSTLGNRRFPAPKSPPSRRDAQNQTINPQSLLAKVEHTLGMALFERTNGGRRPTIEGQEFLNTAQRIVDQTDAMTVRVKNRSRGESGRLTIGVHASFSAGHLRASLSDHQAPLPGRRYAICRRIERPSHL